jgi:hypothetical protein
MPRTLLLAAIGVLTLAVACEVPGTAATNQAIRCARPQTRAAPSIPATSFQPAWRTYSDSSNGLSMSIPDTWGGVFLGTGHVDRDIAEVASRLPDVADGLRQSMAGLGDTYRFVAGDATGTVGLYLSEADALNTTTECGLESVDYFAPGRKGPTGSVRAYAIQLGARHGTELVAREQPRSGADDPAVHLLFFVRSLGGRTTYRLDFSISASALDAVEPLAWRTAASLTELPTGPAALCLFPDPRQPSVDHPAARACPVPAGDQVWRLDCPPDDTLPDPPYRVAYEVLPATALADPSVDRSGASCGVSVEPGGLVSITPSSGAAPQTAVVTDLWMPPDVSDATVTLTLPLHGGHDVVADLRSNGKLTISERAAGTGRPPLATYSLPSLGTRPHRLVLAVLDDQVRVWVDGATYGPVTTTTVSAPGEAHVYLRDADTITAGFKLQGVATYGPVPAHV